MSAIVRRALFGTRTAFRRLATVAEGEAAKEAPKEDAPAAAAAAAATERTEGAVDAKELADLRAKYMRALAETENVRRRGQQQIADVKVFAIQSFSKDLLEVADVLDLALGSVDRATLNANAQLKGLHDGVLMTKDALLKTFNKHGLTVVSPEGEKFDPNFHDALFKIPQKDVSLGAAL